MKPTCMSPFLARGCWNKLTWTRPNLQYKIRRDPLSYQDDFIGQYSQYESFRDLFRTAQDPMSDKGIISFRELIDFIAHVADHYPRITASFPDDLIEILELRHANLEPELREKIVSSLVLLRNKDVIDSLKSVSKNIGHLDNL